MEQVLHLLKQFPTPARRVILVVTVALSSLVCVLVTAQGKQLSPSLEIDAPDQVMVGEHIDITLTVNQADDIAGYETALLFDTDMAYFAGLQQRENDLDKIGRDVGPLTAMDLPDGVAIGLYSCPVEDCVTRLGARKDHGAQGTTRLAVITVIASAPGALEIKLDATKFVDAVGNPVAVAIPNPVISVQVGAPGEGPSYPAPDSMWALSPIVPASTPLPTGLFDLTGDDLVTHADVMEVAIEWVLARQNLAPCGSNLDLTRDINLDGCIDVSDLQMAAAHYSTVTGKESSPILSILNLAQVAGASSIASTFIVNVTSDGDDANIGNGVCATTFNVCTLRAAIQEANAHPGPDIIHFNISGSGVKTIQLKGRLPTLNDASGPTTIDGYTQPGASHNTDPLVSNAVIRIQIAGNGEDRHDGIVITSSGNIVHGLSLYRLKHAVWVFGSGAGDNMIAGNFIGTSAAGSYGAPALINGADGIYIEQGGDRNRIGGPMPADRNVISGNAQSGVGIWHEGTDSNVIQNNLIGMTPSATARLPNRRHGVDINFGSEANVVGGTGPGERNVTSGNDFSGVEISHSAGTTLNRVIGNYIGTDVSGQSAPSWSYNGYTGVTLEDGVTNNIIANNIIGSNKQGGIQITGVGTTDNQIYANRVGISLNGNPIGNLLFGIRADGRNNIIGTNNIIAHNQYNGIVIREDDKDFNSITRNSIYSNGALGIDLVPFGITLNDAGDTDSGPNENLNFPVLESAAPQQVTGTACGGCVVEIFIADGGANTYGEGKTFVGSATADGSGKFVATVSGVIAGNYVTATATDSAGNTSEFSLNLLVQ